MTDCCVWCRYERNIEEDKALIANPDTPVRQKVACRMLVCEKEILHAALDEVTSLPHAPRESEMMSHLDANNSFIKLQ